MARITVEDCLTKETNRFALIHLAAKRAKQILGGAKSVLEDRRDNKTIVNSLREIAAGKVRFMSAAEVEEEARLERERLEAEAEARASGQSVVSNPDSIFLAGTTAAGDSSTGNTGSGDEEVLPGTSVNGNGDSSANF